MNKNNLIIRLIELYYFPRDQYMGPYIFIHIIFYYEKKVTPPPCPPISMPLICLDLECKGIFYP